MQLKENVEETLNLLCSGDYNFNRENGVIIKELSNVILFLSNQLQSVTFDLKMANRSIELLEEKVRDLKEDSHYHL